MRIQIVRTYLRNGQFGFEQVARARGTWDAVLGALMFQADRLFGKSWRLVIDETVFGVHVASNDAITEGDTLDLR